MLIPRRGMPVPCERIIRWMLRIWNLEGWCVWCCDQQELTWNLAILRAYEEWCRVLKPGGKLLISMQPGLLLSLWWGETPVLWGKTESVESEHLDDHYLCTDIDEWRRLHCRCPLSSINRPSWDRKFRRRTGLNLWQWIPESGSGWESEEKLNIILRRCLAISAVRKKTSCIWEWWNGWFW